MENHQELLGAPILNILIKQNLSNILVVVTRYFGGILLGTGGLVKAYTKSATMAIENAPKAFEENGYEIEVTVSYNDLQKFIYYCQKQNILVIKTEYLNKIKVVIQTNEVEKDKLIEDATKYGFNIEDLSLISKKTIRKKCII